MMTEPVESHDGSFDAPFAGELRRFRLTVPDLAKVQKDCEAGPAVIAAALARGVQVLAARADKGLSALAALAAGLGDWRVEYITRPLFHGLVRGGLSPNAAGQLVRQNVEERGWLGLVENLELAFCVITGAYCGPADDPPGEPQGAVAETPAP